MESPLPVGRGPRSFQTGSQTLSLTRCEAARLRRGTAGGNTALSRVESPQPDPVQGGLPTLDGPRNGALPPVAAPVTCAKAVPGQSPSPAAADGTDLRWAQEQDPALLDIGSCLREGRVLDPKRYREWTGILRQHGQQTKIVDGTIGIADGGTFTVAVPGKLRMDIVRMAHDHPSSGHMGRERTAQRVKQRCAASRPTNKNC